MTVVTCADSRAAASAEKRAAFGSTAVAWPLLSRPRPRFELSTTIDWRWPLLHTRFDNLLRRIQGEYLEMPGLRLTPAQAQRLWGLSRHECESLMNVLTDSQFLKQTRDGSFVLFDANSPVPAFDNPTVAA